MTDTRWAELTNVLGGYFGDQSIDVGVAEMLGVTRGDPEYHRRYRDALAAGLAAARAGDDDVLPAVRQLAPFTPDLPAAADLLERILTAYDRGYGA
jgi:hypothetical protein